MNKTRFIELDIARAIAIFAMISYHFQWDLRYFQLYYVEDYSTAAYLWEFYARSIGSSFLFIAGVSTQFLHIRHGVNLKKDIKRFTILALCAFGITLATYFGVSKDFFVYIGILHLLAICTLIGMAMRDWSSIELFHHCRSHPYYLFYALLWLFRLSKYQSYRMDWAFP